jgi:hypothetical protein
MRRGVGGYASRGSDAREEPGGLGLLSCCERLFSALMSCLDALFGCGRPAEQPPSPPRLRRAGATSGDRLLPDGGDDATMLGGALEPPSMERLRRSGSPATPRAVALEPLALPRAFGVEDAEEEDSVRAQKRAAVRDRPEECPMCLEARYAHAEPPRGRAACERETRSASDKHATKTLLQ